ncbi:hypothetical protein TNCV_199491 [Trichonephila clavipes]|nr:hypothetical protein TNCV_199491 [Trichonephila clavipes]
MRMHFRLELMKQYFWIIGANLNILFSETTLVEGITYTFYVVNVKKLIIDKADFEQEEKELVVIFNSKLAFSSNNSNFEMGYRNQAFHFTPIPTGASLDNDTDENDSSQEKNVFRES